MENKMDDTKLLEKYVSLKKSMGKISKLLSSGVDDELSQAEIIIMMKLEPKNEINLSKISEITGFSNTMITFMIDSLEKKGYVERIRGSDRRVYLARLTNKGIDKYVILRDKIRMKLFDLFNKMSEEEKNEFSQSVDNIERLLDKILS